MPTLLRVLCEIAQRESLSLPSLNFIVTSGEPLPSTLADSVHDTWPQVSLFNLYGTSEAWDISWHEVKQSSPESSFVSIGKPIDNTRIFVLDKAMNPVPVGITGEIYTSGHGLATDFLDDTGPHKTTFITAPWDSALRLYGSGDLAKYHVDGNIDFIGREEGHLNLRGFRVDPSELENVIGDYPGVLEVVAMLRQQPESESCLLYTSDAADE